VVVVDGSPGLVDRRGGTVVVVEVEDGWGGATGFKNGGRSGIVARDVKAATGVSIITDVRMVFRSSFILNGGGVIGGTAPSYSLSLFFAARRC